MLVFNKLFFPNFDPTIGLLIAIASFGMPYFFRPLRGVIFSHIGERLGRKKSLVLTLAIMGSSTDLIGILPVYDSIGAWAPILLVALRLVQGIAAGGKWGGAGLLVVEYSEKKKRGFAGSVPMMEAAVGMVLATAAISLMRLLLDAQFLAWGWRVLLLQVFLLVVLGLDSEWFRRNTRFPKSERPRQYLKMPIVDTFKNHWKEVILTTDAKAIETAPFISLQPLEFPMPLIH